MPSRLLFDVGPLSTFERFILRWQRVDREFILHWRTPDSFTWSKCRRAFCYWSLRVDADRVIVQSRSTSTATVTSNVARAEHVPSWNVDRLCVLTEIRSLRTDKCSVTTNSGQLPRSLSSNLPPCSASVATRFAQLTSIQLRYLVPILVSERDNWLQQTAAQEHHQCCYYLPQSLNSRVSISHK